MLAALRWRAAHGINVYKTCQIQEYLLQKAIKIHKSSKPALSRNATTAKNSKKTAILASDEIRQQSKAASKKTMLKRAGLGF
ncbi:MAG: hypothetical protein KA994_03165 [Brachymonas sp.]|nr:hypothetical protein [Brachymonas sp.]MBP7246733.1 hypothetical protein [Brachymonas sp.]MBP7743881.1 hypothetical protein [Brachymonas sp.]MBP8597335.1 hypothetical protein [Brachymonas sp.]